MKILYLDCGMGAAGDMLTAALLELIPDREEFIKELNELGIPHVKFTAEKSVKCGITGTHMSVTVCGEEEGEHHHHHDSHHHEPSHEQCHEHHHHHSGMHEIEHIISHLKISDKVRKNVLSVYNLIAEAESHAHGKPVTEIHFHEVGTMDAIADVTAVCML
ncbi:MAG: nickel insertion protein, partial [Clostridia bacterium]|nr:nickel insertion protein [Clostridia bacterium]